MVFYCKNCDTDINISDEKAKGYYNWKCPECDHIAPIKDSMAGSYQFKCDTGTIRRRQFRKKAKRG